MSDLCQWLDCSRSSYYTQPKHNDETVLREAAEQILLRFPFYGYRKLQKALARQQITVGEYRVRRLLCQLGMTRSVGKVRVRTTDSNHPHPRYPNRIKGLKLTRPDQVWVADITYIRLGRRFIYLAVILDAFTRMVRGWALSRTIDQQAHVGCARPGAGYSDTFYLSLRSGVAVRSMEPYSAFAQGRGSHQYVRQSQPNPKWFGRALYANGEGGTCRL